MRVTMSMSALIKGGVAGLAGTTVWLGMRAFDERYAPLTVASPRRSYDACVLYRAFTGGALAGAVYGLARERQRNRSSLRDGVALGASTYAASWLAQLSPQGIGRRPWQQSFPEHAGAFLRHLAYGVTSAATFVALGDARHWHVTTSGPVTRGPRLQNCRPPSRTLHTLSKEHGHD